MDFQIHRFPASTKVVDLVVIANFSQDEADAFEEARAWDQLCISKISVSRAFWTTITRGNLTFRKFIKPGVLLEEFEPSYADSFQEKFQTQYVLEAQKRFLPIITAYRRKMHREHERQRDSFMGASAPLQITHQPQVTIINHDQQYLPAPR